MAFPDPVALTITYLRPIVAPAHIGSRVPDPRPERFVQVRRVGGAPLPPVRDRGRLDVFTWAPTEPDAMDIALDIRTAIWALAGTTLLGPVVYEVGEFMAPRMTDDDLTGTPKTWATYELTIRADDVIHTAPGAFS